MTAGRRQVWWVEAGESSLVEDNDDDDEFVIVLTHTWTRALTHTHSHTSDFRNALADGGGKRAFW